MTSAASASYRAAGAQLREQDGPEPEYWRCACGAFLPQGPAFVGSHWLAWTCKRCHRTRIIEDWPAPTYDGEPF